jgi:undecaprenyl diphosphate synthase
MDSAEAQTADNTRLTLTIAVNYGGRWDIAKAARRLASQAVAGDIRVEDIDSDALNREICMADLPAPDLFIRTGGEQRISNFLLWQLAYSELYFTDRLWPEFDAEALDEALASFAGRQRRFGQTSDQVEQSRRA